MQKKYLFCLLAILFAGVVSAQKHIYSDNSATSRLPRSDSRHFTYKNVRHSHDRNGRIFSSDAHLLGFWVEGSYSNILHNIDNVSKTPGGYGVGMGLSYEYQHNYFMLQTGLGVAFQDIKSKFDGLQFNNWDLASTMWDQDVRFYPAGKMPGGELMDSYGIPIDKLTYKVSGRSDIVRTLYLQIPLMFGGYTDAGFYGMAGVKLNFAVWGKTHMKQAVTSTGEYNSFIGTMGEMDNHGYRTLVELKKDGGKVPFKTDILLSGELGYEYRQDPMHIRIACFADYGLLNINPGTDSFAFHFTYPEKWNFDQFDISHVFNSELTSQKEHYNTAESSSKLFNMHNLFVGVKLTIMFQLPQSEKCIICQHRRYKR